MFIKKFIFKFKVLRLTFLVLRYIITSVNVVIGCFILSVLVDKIVPMPIFLYHIYWMIISIILVLFFLNLLFRVIETLKRPYKHIQEELYKNNLLQHRDDLVNAYLIENELLSNKPLNFSKELSYAFLKSIENILEKINIYQLTGFDRIKKVFPLNIVLISIILVLYFLPPQAIKPNVYKILFAKRLDILGAFISPKNIKVPYGESCVIKVIVEKDYEIYKPELFIKNDYSKKFIKTQFTDIETYKLQKIYKYEIKSVENKILYRIKFRGINSKVYTIEPIVLPEINDIKILVSPPKYTKLKPYYVQSFSETKFFYGSNIEFTVHFNKEITKAYLTVYNSKQQLKKETKKSFSGSFKAIKDNELLIEVYDTENLSNLLKYQFKVAYDAPPKIEILSPEKEIVVDKMAQVPIVYSAKDDIGVSKIKFIYRNAKKKQENSFVIEKLEIHKHELLNEYIFDLTRLNVEFGDIINYYLVAYDNDEFSGPKSAMTEEYKIEIFSYEKQHDSIKKDIQNFVDETIKTLSKEIEFKEKLLSVTTSHQKLTNDLIREREFFHRDFENLSKRLESVLDKMYLDPYTSIDTYMEFRNLKSQLNNLKEINSKLAEKLKQNDLDSSFDLQEQIINTLERASAISEKILKKQNMQNISEMMKETKDISKDFLDHISKLSNLSKDDKTKLLNLLKEMEDKLNKIANMLKETPNELPYEFINRKDVKNLDFLSPMGLIDQIYSAISRNDINSALKLMEALLKQLDYLSKILSEASSDFLSSRTSFLKEKLDDIIKELDDLISSQQEIYDSTKNIDEYRIKELLRLQEKLLEEISKKINQILIKIKNIENLPEFTKFINKHYYKFNSDITTDNLKKILTEIKNKKLTQTQFWIKESILYWDRNVSLIEDLNQLEYNELINYTMGVKNDLNELNNLFNYSPRIEYPNKILEENTKIKNKQNNLIKKTNDFLEKLKSLGKDSFIISSNDILLTLQARTEMQLSENNLSKLAFPDALQNQNNATNLLLQLKDNFSEKKTMFEQIQQSMGSSMSSKFQIKSSSTGRYGAMTSRVVLPSAKEYNPPKELREDIIKSLSEKYPEEFKKIIEEYYKKILKQ